MHRGMNHLWGPEASRVDTVMGTLCYYCENHFVGTFLPVFATDGINHDF